MSTSDLKFVILSVPNFHFIFPSSKKWTSRPQAVLVFI